MVFFLKLLLFFQCQLTPPPVAGIRLRLRRKSFLPPSLTSTELKKQFHNFFCCDSESLSSSSSGPGSLPNTGTTLSLKQLTPSCCDVTASNIKEQSQTISLATPRESYSYPHNGFYRSGEDQVGEDQVLIPPQLPSGFGLSVPGKVSRKSSPTSFPLVDAKPAIRQSNNDQQRELCINLPEIEDSPSGFTEVTDTTADHYNENEIHKAERVAIHI